MPAPLTSPALPAGVLLFGMVFCLAGAHFVGLPWQTGATAALYGVLAAWVGVLAWQRRRDIPPLGAIDWLFILFMGLVLASAAACGFSAPGLQKYGRYLPFLVVVPYLCGRLMGTADLLKFVLVLASAGLGMLPLLLIDYFWSPEVEGRSARWPFFGYDHSALLIGMLLAGALVSLASYVVAERNEPSGASRTRSAMLLAAIGLASVAVVVTGGRGAALAAVIGTTFLCLTAHWRRPVARLLVPLYVVGVVIASLMALPKPQAQFYGNLATRPLVVLGSQAGETAEEADSRSGPILGTASCRPFEEGTNSVAMRWVLYQEAVAIFLDRPWLGTGPALFGKYSCTGSLGFPHSTVLQAFAELGLAGGALYLGLMAAAFIALARRTCARAGSRQRTAAWVGLALFTTYLLTDQIYGNYFMATATYLLAGVAAGMDRQAGANREEARSGDE